MKNKGFTFVELAIVIVIIGLLVGGVLQGQELINQSKITSAVSKVQSYNAAVNTFRAKYNAIPGDIINPGQFGLNTTKGTSTVNTCYTTFGAVTPTSGGGGNGNGILGIVIIGADCASSTGGTFTESISTSWWPHGEVNNFFVHLSNGQFVKENFSQIPRPVSGILHNPQVGTAYPTMPVGVGMMALSERGLNYWVLGTAKFINTSGDSVGNNLSPSEAFGIDSKLDDGVPNSGAIQAVSAYGSISGSTFTISSASPTTCVFTGNVYNIAGSVSDNKLCTIRVQVSF